MKNLAIKLLAFQKEIGIIPKDSTNPFFKSNYADINTYLEVVKPILSKHGLVLLQPLTQIDGKAALRTILMDTESEDVFAETTILPENPDPQKMGAIITYFRRYGIQSLLSLEAKDTDANDTLPVSGVKNAVVNDMPFGGEEVCSKCNSPMATSKTKGTKYCSALCWKK